MGNQAISSRQSAATGCPKYVNAVAIDPFPEQRGTPEDSYRLMLSIKKQLARAGVHKPFWNNEINYGIAGAHDPTTSKYSMDMQQSYVIRTYALSAAAEMEKTFWLAWSPNAELGVQMSDSSGTGLPTATSYEVVRTWLNATDFEGCATNKSGLWTCTAKAGPGGPQDLLEAERFGNHSRPLELDPPT